jgi:hypothetical protein
MTTRMMMANENRQENTKKYQKGGKWIVWFLVQRFHFSCHFLLALVLLTPHTYTYTYTYTLFACLCHGASGTASHAASNDGNAPSSCCYAHDANGCDQA